MQQENKNEQFIKEYGELVKKYEVDFMTYPVFVPTENGTFTVAIQTVPVDINKTQQNVKTTQEFIKPE